MTATETLDLPLATAPDFFPDLWAERGPDVIDSEKAANVAAEDVWRHWPVGMPYEVPDRNPSTPWHA